MEITLKISSWSIFGGIFFVGMIVLMIADGGELLDPFFLTVMVFVYICFVFFMSLLFYSFAKPVQINLKVGNKEYFLKQVSEISEKNGGENRLRNMMVNGAISLGIDIKIG